MSMKLTSELTANAHASRRKASLARPGARYKGMNGRSLSVPTWPHNSRVLSLNLDGTHKTNYTFENKEISDFCFITHVIVFTYS